jgi:cardiolipin synthase (CMP-forming)
MIFLTKHDKIKVMKMNFIFMNLPNALTFIRIACVPVICVGIFYSYFTVALIVFLVAAGTDYLDGYFAQRFHSQTAFGALLDPLADKLLVILTWFLLASRLSLMPIQLGAMAVMTFREVLILGLRQLPKHHLPVIKIAKWKTLFQILGTISCLLSQTTPQFFLQEITTCFFVFACFLSLVSGFSYLLTVYRNYFP